MKDNIEIEKMFVKLADYPDAYNMPYSDFVKDIAKEVINLMPKSDISLAPQHPGKKVTKKKASKKKVIKKITQSPIGPMNISA